MSINADRRTDLSKRVLALAEKGHTRAIELREKADAFDKATAGFYAEPQTITVQKFMGSYARARRLWRDVTGESLV